MRNIFNGAIIKIAILLMGVAGISVSCTAGFDEINNPKNKLNLEELSRDNYQVGAYLIQLQDNAFPEQENAYQMNYDLIGNYLGRYFTYANNGFSNNNFARFNAPNGWAGYPYKDRTPKIESAFKAIKRISTKEDLAYQWGSILRISGLICLSDQYGPFPIGADPKNPNAYSSQKDIYEMSFKVLDEAINSLHGYLAANKGKLFFEKYDHVYGGDFTKWLKYANSLKLRLAIRIRFVEPNLAKKYAEEAVADGVMTENSDNLKIQYPIYGIYKTSVEWGDSRMCADLDSYMNGYNDPRLEKYFSPVKYLTGRKYAGCLAGANIGNKQIADAVYSAANAKQTDKGVWMTASEMYFCRAEGALIGWDMGGTAEDLYNKGITSSFDQWGATGAEDYINNSTNTPMDYTDVQYGYGQSMSATSNITIKWDNSASLDKKLERIIVQKWIAMFPLGEEAWCEIRRTGYPKVFQVPTGTNGYSLLVPNRIPYPENQKVINPDNYKNAIQMLGGSDDYAGKMWWQK